MISGQNSYICNDMFTLQNCQKTYTNYKTLSLKGDKIETKCLHVTKNVTKMEFN